MIENLKRNPYFLLFKVLSLLLIVLTLTGFAKLSKPDLVRFTIENRSKKILTIQLNGPAYYYLVINPGQNQIYTIKRGVYSHTIYHCGIYTSGETDLTRQSKLIRSSCSGSPTKQTRAKNKKDLAEDVKIVKIFIKNEFDDPLVVTFSGIQNYSFLTYSGQKSQNSFDVYRGQYDVKFFACDRMHYLTFNARSKRTLKITDKYCPYQ